MNTKIIVNKLKKLVKHLATSQQQRKAKLALAAANHKEEMDENALNEAIEIALSQRLAMSPAAVKQEFLRLRLAGVGEVSVYSGCQVAGPQS